MSYSYTSGGDPAGPAGRPHQLRWGSVERVTSEAAPETGAEGWADVEAEALSDSSPSAARIVYRLLPEAARRACGPGLPPGCKSPIERACGRPASSTWGDPSRSPSRSPAKTPAMLLIETARPPPPPPETNEASIDAIRCSMRRKAACRSWLERCSWSSRSEAAELLRDGPVPLATSSSGSYWPWPEYWNAHPGCDACLAPPPMAQPPHPFPPPPAASSRIFASPSASERPRFLRQRRRSRMTAYAAATPSRKAAPSGAVARSRAKRGWEMIRSR
mmetsp:Transcript_36022/g.117214  ORF Transcript_36022/g.117214 Transcript_36022/m.117214 type:complete len:275 (-) Transcript_36022:888-1712(-)